MITLFHGSYLEITSPNVKYGRSDNNVIDTVEDFENGIITAEQALGQLQYKRINHQICIRNQEIIDKFLYFQSSHEVQYA